MPNPVRNLHKVDETTFDYIVEENASVVLKDGSGIVRCNVYRPKGENLRSPVLVTYGPYGKDVHYGNFNPASFSDLPESQKSPHSAWETPDPGFWTREGYAVVRADERGAGQSMGLLDTMSRGTSEAFVDVIEWAADQEWSNGKIGLLGVSYFAGTQWRVAARRPRGLACIIPWEGMSDYYRDRCRHGGILSNTFIKFWWDRQIITNQYGRPGRAARNWGFDTLEGDLPEPELAANRRDQNQDNEQNHYLDEDYYASRDYNLGDIEVPLLSVANWGGILLHLRGNVEGYINAGSRLKYLRFITGRHDLPFYSDENVQLQKSFLDAFLKGQDVMGWSTAQVPKVAFVLRKGDVGYNNAEAEKQYEWREALEWPIPHTDYQRYYLSGFGSWGPCIDHMPCLDHTAIKTISYQALGTLKHPQMATFVTEYFTTETEFTGHIVVHLNVSVSRAPGSNVTPSDIDLFVTLRHLDAKGKEIYYTGTVGDPVPVTKGWLRTSLRKTDRSHPKHQDFRPYREYRKSDVLPVVPGEVYAVDVEVWPTNVVVSPGNRLVLEISSGDTQGAGLFEHNSQKDRPVEVFEGINNIHFGPGRENWVMMPWIRRQNSP